ncbi:HAD-IB family hydrolase [Dyadobacter sp. CY261]|uniref:HAD-IB family hydrolase n=1 Tax=Dyadobacter sp. CY261 TaxID=2907203 RepID=UPI001F27CC0A|nr:HAD-IB family hydrolase [Dyadobacter sp. CY261]
MGGEVRDSRKVIAVFDFDGTITNRDSFFLFLWYSQGLMSLLLKSILSIPTLTLYATKAMPNYQAKERIFSIFFGNLEMEKFERCCESFRSILNSVIKPNAIQKIKWHQEMGHEVVILSASAENWIIPWAKGNGIYIVLATQLQVKDSRLTGKFKSRNCYGAEKVARLLNHFPGRQNYELYAYGDSRGDKELLEIADHSFYRKFM